MAPTATGGVGVGSRLGLYRDNGGDHGMLTTVYTNPSVLFMSNTGLFEGWYTPAP